MLSRMPPLDLVRFVTRQLNQTTLASSRADKRSHPKSPKAAASKKPRTMSTPSWENPIPHPIYSAAQLDQVQETHHEPRETHEKVAHGAVRLLRRGFDFVTGYKGPDGGMTRNDWLNRCIFLESIAGIPGMVAGTIRHLRSLRNMERDRGWIHTLEEESENERMHLLIFMTMKDPGLLFRLLVRGGQGVFLGLYLAAYLVSPKTCHRFVAYMEEEAVHTYTAMIQDIDEGNVTSWKAETAPRIAREYYHLTDDAKLVDMVKCIRADETNHRDVNHTLAKLDWKHDVNPFPPWTNAK